MAPDFTETADETALSQLGEHGVPEPGVVIVFSAGEPMCGVLPMAAGTASQATGSGADMQTLRLGRGRLEGVSLHDNCMSRQHATIFRSGDEWQVTDHGSRNGTFVDGRKIQGTVQGADFRTVRTGESVFLLADDVKPFLARPVEMRDESIIGVKMESILRSVVRAAQAGVLHITGETGSGKEVVSRFFHEFGTGRSGPFVAVNCATVPEGVAERLLFGARRGAYSGADRDARGLVQEASGGTLFLDEVGELDLNVQAKLLRVLETHEVLPLGASRPIKVDIRVCSATHRDLRQSVADGSFREDLFFRLGRPQVALPPLRERPEEIPFLIEKQLRGVSSDLIAQAALVQSCMHRHWPGNVRELLAEVRDAAYEAVGASKTSVKLSHLAEDAGRTYESVHDSTGGRPSPAAALPGDEQIREVLKSCGGKVATAARQLNVHRNQLRRWLDKNPETKAAMQALRGEH